MGSRHQGTVAVPQAADVEPHVPALLRHRLTVDGSDIPTAVAAVAPHRHWQMPKFDIAVIPVAHVTPVHGSKLSVITNIKGASR